MTDKNTQTKAIYTLADVGCYVDGARGIYAVDAIVQFAVGHGMGEPSEYHSVKSLADCEFADEVEDDTDDYMNDQYGVEGAYWGRNENSDWGLWEIEQD
jgi:hypothetical protein